MRAVGEVEEEAEAEALVAEAEGLRLHLSSSNATGYRGVRKHRSSGRFEALHRVDGRKVYIGCFDMAVEAAVAVVRAVAEMEGSGEWVAEDETTATTPRRAEKRPLEAAKAPPPKRRSSEIPAVSFLSPSSSSARASPSSYGASSGAASTSGVASLPPSRLFKLLPDGRTVHREPPPSMGGIAAVAEALARIGLQAYVAAFDAEGYDDIEYLRGLDAAERAEVATETDMKPGHAGRWGKYGFGEI